MLRTVNRLPQAASDWLSLAAAPTFAVMALVTAAGGAGPLDVLCSGASPLGGMAAMYGLMSAFHMAPWLRLISERCRPEAGQRIGKGKKMPPSFHSALTPRPKRSDDCAPIWRS